MDRERKKLDNILTRISPKELLGAELHGSELIYNVIGFIPTSDFVDNAMLISNLGYLISQKGLNTCIVDFKVFYPNLFQFLNVPPNKKGTGLIKLLKNDRVDFREEIQATKYDHLYLLSPSPQDLIEEYFDFSFDHIDRVISNLKNMFDIVLIDVPNNPPLEFCLGAMKYCHMGFLTGSERVETIGNAMKLLDFASSVGISTAKFNNIILTNVLNLTYDYKVFNDAGFKIIAALPLVKLAYSRALEGRLYVKDNPIMDKYYYKNIEVIIKVLTNSDMGG